MIYSLIETAKENGLAPYRYFIHVLTEAPRLAAKAVVGQRIFCTCLMRCWMHCPDVYGVYTGKVQRRFLFCVV